MALVLGGGVAVLVRKTSGVSHAAAQKNTVVYSVTGTGPTANLSYSTAKEDNGHKGLAEDAGVSVPWTKTITASGRSTGFTLSAENGSGGSITCTISENDKVIATNTATGAYAIASCGSTASN